MNNVTINTIARGIAENINCFNPKYSDCLRIVAELQKIFRKQHNIKLSPIISSRPEESNE